MNRTVPSIDALAAEYRDWADSHGLPKLAAEDMLHQHRGMLSSDQIDYLHQFQRQWDAAQDFDGLRRCITGAEYVAARGWQQLDALTTGLNGDAQEQVIEALEVTLELRFSTIRDEFNMTLAELADLLVAEYLEQGAER